MNAKVHIQSTDDKTIRGLWRALCDTLGDSRATTVAPNTYAERNDTDTVFIRLYHTDIITVERSRLHVSNGGYRTTTTKQRMNAVLRVIGYSVTVRRGRWFLVTGDGNELLMPFDGVVDSILVEESDNE